MPAIQSSAVPAQPDAPQSLPRILAVDDQRDSLLLLQMRLRSAGFDCITANSGQAGLDLLARELVDVIILDVMMPGMDGFEVCQRIKADPRTADIPVLFLTATTEMEDKVRGLEVGGQDYLGKPVDQQELLARTRAALRVKQLQDELKKKLQLQEQINQLHQRVLTEHWQKTFGQLAASLAHEINNPLAIALGSVQLLGLDQDLRPDFRTRLEVVDQSLQRAGRKLRSLLLIAQSTREPQSIQLSQLLDDLLALINYRVMLQKITVETHWPKLCEWRGMPAQLARALLYVFDNALEAMAKTSNATLRVSVEPEGSNQVIRIIDNGCGIPADARPRIFEPFFTTKPPPHNGIGLYLASEIVKDAGGTIECPEAVGGTEFKIILPAAPPSGRSK